MKSYPHRARGWRQFTLGMIAYAVIVVLEGFLLEPATLSPALGVVFAVLPLGAAVWAMLGWLEAVRSDDELQRKIYSEAGLFSLGITAVFTLGYGFLELLADAPRLSMFVVWFLVAAGYTVGVSMGRKRYR